MTDAVVAVAVRRKTLLAARPNAVVVYSLARAVKIDR